MKHQVFSTIFAVAILLTFSATAAHGRAFGMHDDGSGDDGSEVEFTGTIEGLPSTGFIGDWMISGRTVHVTTSTELDMEGGAFVLGARVKVEGQARADSSVDAREIELAKSGDPEDSEDEVEFKGTVTSLPSTAGFIGDWIVGGKTVHVSASTRIDTEHGPVRTGAFVEVKATMRDDGSLDALRIEVENDEQGEDGRAEVKGTIQSLPSSGLVGDWVVAGRVIHVISSTAIDQEHGDAAVGAFVEVTGNVNADGSIDATRIEVKGSEGQPDSFKGTVQAMPSSGLIGDWTIGGRTVHVVSSTRIKSKQGSPEVGIRVKVKGLLMGDGSTVATRIQVKR
jgi:hypothetical protein